MNVPQPNASRYPDYHQMAEQEAIESDNADQRRCAPLTAPTLDALAADWQQHLRRDAGAQPTSDKRYTPRKGAPVRYAVYGGSLEGYASVTDDWTLLFRSPGALWYPTDQNELVILGLVGDAEAQLALDRCAGGYAAIACSRANREV
jgi:hypothetical protein